MFKIQPLLLMLFFGLIACSPEKTDKISAIVPHCLKSQSKCFIETKFGRIEVLFNQEKVLTERPFKIYLNVTEISDTKGNKDITETEEKEPRYKISKVKSYMEGKEMFMGKIPVFFSSSKQEEVMIAETLLGSCSEDKMVWRLWLTVFFENKRANNKEIKNLQETLFIDFTSNRF